MHHDVRGRVLRSQGDENPTHTFLASIEPTDAAGSYATLWNGITFAPLAMSAR